MHHLCGEGKIFLRSQGHVRVLGLLQEQFLVFEAIWDIQLEPGGH
jgi:hypothetical protein